MSNEIIQSVTYVSYDEFQHLNIIISQIFTWLFWKLFNDETDLKLRCPFTSYVWCMFGLLLLHPTWFCVKPYYAKKIMFLKKNYLISFTCFIVLSQIKT
jgi:hypothetical protein